MSKSEIRHNLQKEDENNAGEIDSHNTQLTRKQQSCASLSCVLCVYCTYTHMRLYA